jgi:hypothetical protein
MKINPLSGVLGCGTRWFKCPDCADRPDAKNITRGEVMLPANSPTEPPIIATPKLTESPTPPKKEGFSYYLSLLFEWGKAKIHIAIGRY